LNVRRIAGIVLEKEWWVIIRQGLPETNI
jgi:hypothetical protein